MTGRRTEEERNPENTQKAGSLEKSALLPVFLDKKEGYYKIKVMLKQLAQLCRQSGSDCIKANENTDRK